MVRLHGLSRSSGLRWRTSASCSSSSAAWCHITCIGCTIWPIFLRYRMKTRCFLPSRPLPALTWCLFLHGREYAIGAGVDCRKRCSLWNLLSNHCRKGGREQRLCFTDQTERCWYKVVTAVMSLTVTLWVLCGETKITSQILCQKIHLHFWFS